MMLLKKFKICEVGVGILGVDILGSWLFWEVDILGVDILGVDILGVDILRLTYLIVVVLFHPFKVWLNFTINMRHQSLPPNACVTGIWNISMSIYFHTSHAWKQVITYEGVASNSKTRCRIDTQHGMAADICTPTVCNIPCCVEGTSMPWQLFVATSFHILYYYTTWGITFYARVVTSYLPNS